MTEDEKLKSIPDIKEKGNALYKEKNYDLACEMYAKGIGILEQVMLGSVYKYVYYFLLLLYHICYCYMLFVVKNQMRKNG